MSQLSQKLGMLAVSTVALYSPLIAGPLIDEPSVEIDFSYRAANGETKSGSNEFAVNPGEASDNMKAAVLVLAIGRTIQTFVKDWNNGKTSPTLFQADEPKPVASTSTSKILGLP